MSDEQILYHGSPSLILKSRQLALGGLALVGSLVAAVFVTLWLLILSAVAVFFILFQVLLVKARVYELTTERVRVTNGIFTKRTEELELYRVKDTALVEPLSYRFLGLGNIEMTTSDPSTPIVLIEAIADAKVLREQLRKGIESCRLRKGVRVAELE